MDWNGSIRTFVPRPDPSFNFLFNCNYDHHQYPGMEMWHPTAMAEATAAATHGLVPVMEKNCYGNDGMEKKKRLTNDQLESLERSFQDEIKLDPDRKMKLSRELGLQPRQIAIWFQNRRARWKGKQLERLYDALKQEFDVVSKEKQKLLEEVMKLRAMLRDKQVTARNQASTGYTEVSGEETVESTSIRSSDEKGGAAGRRHQIAQCNYLFNVDEYNPISSPPCWGVQPSSNPS
ncbi:hypothetical protein SLA2020_468200 [Shorea laevis]